MPQRKKVADKPEPTVVSIREGEESMQLLADAILRVADAADELRRGPLKRRAIVLLIQDRTKLSQGTITAVLDALPHLREYVKAVR
jgi:hypothetical protein